eukprot:7148046-Prymnesium_polylepis.1
MRREGWVVWPCKAQKRRKERRQTKGPSELRPPRSSTAGATPRGRTSPGRTAGGGNRGRAGGGRSVLQRRTV